MVFRLTRNMAVVSCIAWIGIASAGGSAAKPPSGGLTSSERAGTTPYVLPDTLTLGAAIDLALSSHPDLRVSGAELLVARADSEFARVPAFNPQVELQGARGGQTLVSGSESTLELGISQELEFWGKRAARQAVATSRSATSAAQWHAKRQEIELGVRARFEHALFLQSRQILTDQLVDLDRRVVLATQARVRDGSVTPVSGRLTELDLLRLEAQSLRAHSDLRQAIIALGLAIGLEIPDSTRLGGEAQADSLRVPEDSLIAIALRVRGTGEVLRREIAERQAELHLAQREARPNLTLGLGLLRERRSIAGDDFTGDPAVVGGIASARSTENLWTARISAPLPLWQKNQADRARASAAIVLGQLEYDRYLVLTQMDVLGAFRRFDGSSSPEF